MGNWKVVVAEATTNIVGNPSVERNTTGYAGVGAATALAQSATYQRRGVYSLRVTPDTGAGDGVYYGTVTLADATAYTWTFQIRGASGIAYKAYFADTSGNLQGTATTFSGTGAWQCVTVTYTAAGTAARRLYVVKDNVSGNTDVFYLDAMQVEEKAYATTYCDGDQDGCRWVGAAHSSTSTRDADAYQGGRVRDLADDYYAPVLDESGMGAPPLNVVSQPYALLPGGTFENAVEQASTWQLVCWLTGTSQGNLMQRHKALLDVLHANRRGTPQPVRIQYVGDTRTLYTDAVFAGGLEGGARKGFTEQIALRFTSHDPMWYEDADTGATFDTYQDLAVDCLAAKIDGTWTALGAPGADADGGNVAVSAIARAPDGTVWLGGRFLNFAGVAAADRLARYDPVAGTYSAIGTGCDNSVTCIAFAPDGTPYIGGSFTTANGVACRGVAYWTGVTFAPLGAGITSGPLFPDTYTVRCMAFTHDGKLHVGGSIGGVDNQVVHGYAVWDHEGGAWDTTSTVANSGADIYAMAVDQQGDLYVTGSGITSMGGVSAAGIAKYGRVSGAWTALSTGVDNIGYALAVMPNNDLVVAGTIATAGGVTVYRIARWNGQAFDAMGLATAPTAIVNLMVDPHGNLWAEGVVLTGGAGAVSSIQRFNGYSWTQGDFIVPTGLGLDEFANLAGEMWCGIGSTDATTAPCAVTTTITNGGDGAAAPVVQFARTGGTAAQVCTLINETAGHEMFFAYDLADGETLTLDLRRGRTAVTSSYRGKAVGATPVPGSTLAGWVLRPGANLVSSFVSETGSPTVTGTMRWQNSYLGIDGAA
jgi:hypothetical protein